MPTPNYEAFCDLPINCCNRGPFVRNNLTKSTRAKRRLSKALLGSAWGLVCLFCLLLFLFLLLFFWGVWLLCSSLVAGVWLLGSSLHEQRSRSRRCTFSRGMCMCIYIIYIYIHVYDMRVALKVHARIWVVGDHFCVCVGDRDTH